MLAKVFGQDLPMKRHKEARKTSLLHFVVFVWSLGRASTVLEQPTNRDDSNTLFGDIV